MRRTAVLTTLWLGFATAVLAGCAGAPGPAAAGKLDRPVQAGDCLGPEDETASRSDDAVLCSAPGARYRVLAVRGSSEDCYDVSGVDLVEPRSDAVGLLCLSTGPGEPAATVNVAKVGDCVTDTGTSEIRLVPCTDPAAVDRVLGRVERAGLLGGDCADTPGTKSTYQWSLQSSDGKFQDLRRKIVFCLAPKGDDPATSPDAARVGDRLAERSDDYVRVDCGAPDARLRVLHRLDSNLLDIATACGTVRGATSGVERDLGGLTEGYVLCLGPR